MHQKLENLSEEEREELLMIPVWVGILIAGADNKIDSREIKGAVKAVKAKRREGSRQVKEYYEQAALKFEVNLKGYIALMPKSKKARVDFLVKKLERVNYFFSILERDFARQLYLSYRNLANDIAHASGGFFGLLSISFAESNFVDLKMIFEPSTSK